MSKFPFFNMQQLNLDWLMKQMQRILAFLPINSGTAGQILQRGSDSARWVNIGAVSMDIHGLETAETVTGSDELPVYNTSVEGWTGETSSVGSDQAHNNMPPYLAVYMWKRTA